MGTLPDHDDINEAIYDAVCDGEGRANARDLLHHLEKHGLTIVTISQPKAINNPANLSRESRRILNE